MMLKESFSKNVKTKENTKVCDANSETRKGKFIGEVIDTFINPLTNERTLMQHGFNLVVNECSVLIAMLMKGGCNGIQYFAVGSGSDTWDNNNLPNPEENDVKLLNEIFRKPITSDNIVYIDDSNNISETPTNRLQITITLLEDEANGELREMGFFGGDATLTKDSGHLINRKIHGSIFKTSGMQLERVIRFTF